jgi:hypothetical protein
VHTTGTETVAGDKTFTGNTTLNDTTVANGKTLTVGNSSNNPAGTAFAVNTGAGLTGSGVAITGNGDFSGTLMQLTADQTTAGTVLGISAQNLTTGKAIDVSLGSLYNGASNVGAVNVRAASFTNNLVNVVASGQTGTAGNLVNFKSAQVSGQVLNVDAASLTTGKAVSVTLGTQGTGIYLNTAASGYTGNLVQLRANGSDRLVIDQAGNTTLGGTLTVQGASITGPASGAFSIDNGNGSAINIGGTTATTLNLGRSGQTQALLGNTTVAGTLNVSGVTTATGGLKISSTGATILAHLSQTYTPNPNFGSVAYGACADLSQTLTGAALGDQVVVSANRSYTAGTTLSGFVSIANTVVLRWCNLNGAAVDPDGANGATVYRIDVWQH